MLKDEYSLLLKMTMWMTKISLVGFKKILSITLNNLGNNQQLWTWVTGRQRQEDGEIEAILVYTVISEPAVLQGELVF